MLICSAVGMPSPAVAVVVATGGWAEEAGAILGPPTTAPETGSPPAAAEGSCMVPRALFSGEPGGMLGGAPDCPENPLTPVTIDAIV